MSVAKIEYPETMDETRMRPRKGGLNDPRLGTIDRNFRCLTVCIFSFFSRVFIGLLLIRSVSVNKQWLNALVILVISN